MYLCVLVFSFNSKDFKFCPHYYDRKKSIFRGVFQVWHIPGFFCLFVPRIRNISTWFRIKMLEGEVIVQCGLIMFWLVLFFFLKLLGNIVKVMDHWWVWMDVNLNCIFILCCYPSPFLVFLLSGFLQVNTISYADKSKGFELVECAQVLSKNGFQTLPYILQLPGKPFSSMKKCMYLRRAFSCW